MTQKFTKMFWAIAFLLTLVSLSVDAQQVDTQQEWTQFLGTAGDGETQASPPIKWDANNYRWETELTGTGWSSPVYSGKHVWLTSAVSKPATEEQIAKKREGVQFADMKTVAGAIVLRAICVNLESGSIVHDLSLIHI